MKKIEKDALSKYSSLDKNQAFWIYFQEGEKRSLNKVAKKMGVPLYVVKAWSKEGNWSEKVKENEELMDDSKIAKEKASLAKLAEIKIFALYTAALNDRDASLRDKIAAADKLKSLVEQSSKLKVPKKLVIRVQGQADFIKKLREAGVKIRDDLQ